MPDRHFWSRDRRFGLRIGELQLRKMLEMCIAGLPNETGGILAGHYTKTHDCAIVRRVSGPPADSKYGRTWFQRGVAGLQSWLEHLWAKKTYYLGEWHFHPYAMALPSTTDTQQLTEISIAIDYHCPEPLLLILGGNPNADWHLRVFVFPRGRALVEMPEQLAPESGNWR